MYISGKKDLYCHQYRPFHVIYDAIMIINGHEMYNFQSRKQILYIPQWPENKPPLNQIFFSQKSEGGAYISELLIFLQNIDFWAIKWSEEAKNIFWKV